jgi:hypothetical protein
MPDRQFRVEDDRYQTEPPVKSNKWAKGCLLGCLAAVIVFLILGAIATFWVSRNWREWIASGATVAVHQSIDDSQLPDEEKKQIKADADRFILGFREGRVSMEQFGLLVQKFAESPLMTTFVASAVETQYLGKSGLSDEEKADARITLQRFMRGVIDNKIDNQTRDRALSNVADRQPDGNWQFRETVTDAEIRAFVTEAKKAADDAQIPPEPPEFDPSDEVKRIIDEVMAMPAGAPPDGQPAPPSAEPAAPVEVPSEESAPPAVEETAPPEGEDEVPKPET